MQSFIQELEKKAARKPMRVVYPEGNEAEIIQAASIAVEKGIAIPVLIGDESIIVEKAKTMNVSLHGISVLPLASPRQITEMGKRYIDGGGIFPRKSIEEQFEQPLYYGAMLVREAQADAMVAGLQYSTPEVIFAAQTVIGMKEGIQTPSSIFLMEVPDYESEEGNLVVFADGGVCPNPDADELADIAICTADTVRMLLEWEPRLALLSFSTKGSAENEMLEKVINSLEIIKNREPELKVDGELQLDAAIVPAIAKKKVHEYSDVAGKANILIFPDLNAGNITYKAVQRFAHANAYGPFLQGFAKTVSDLSRGSSVTDIIGITSMAVVCAQCEMNQE